MKSYILKIMIGVAAFSLVACSKEQVSETVEMKQFIEENGKTGLTKKQVSETFGEASAIGEISGEEVWLYDDGGKYEHSFSNITIDAFKEGEVDYQLYVVFVNDLAYRYSYIYEQEDELWQLQLMPGGEEPIHAKVNVQ
ncbi:MAG: PhoU family transcriptional regulator [Caryophanon sp.]|nr:PhoU family transcriptional regulator [Caryophanon sp.]